MGRSVWIPVHDFCEQNQIACVFPAIDVIPEPGEDWYSMHFSPGVELEARVLARYSMEQKGAEDRIRNIVQVYSDACTPMRFCILKLPAMTKLHGIVSGS